MYSTADLTFWTRRHRQQQILVSAKEQLLHHLNTTDNTLEALRQATLTLRRTLGATQPSSLLERCQRAYTDCGGIYREGWLVKHRLDSDAGWLNPDGWMSTAIALEYAAVGMERALLHHEPLNPDHLLTYTGAHAADALGAVTRANAACLLSLTDLIQELRLWAARLVAA